MIYVDPNRTHVKLNTIRYPSKKENNMPSYPLDYAIKLLRDAIDFAEAEGDFVTLRLAATNVEQSAKDTISDYDEGMRLMLESSKTDAAPSTLDQKLVDAWRDETIGEEADRVARNFNMNEIPEIEL